MSLSKLRQEKHKNYFTDIKGRININVKMLNNSKSTHESFKTKTGETRKLFHGHFIQDGHKDKEVK